MFNHLGTEFSDIDAFMQAYENKKYHHTSLQRGYVSVKTDGIVERYHGKFGDGFTVRFNNPQSTQYNYIAYYV